MLEGAIDSHAHPAPDVIERSQSIAEAANDFAGLGCAGFVAKSHVIPTTTMVAATAPHPVSVFSSITLNSSVGGLNAGAVEIAANMGARVVWMPTFDSLQQHQQHVPPATPGVFAVDQRSPRRPLVPLLDNGKPVAALHDVLDVAAEYDLTIASGHVSKLESMSLVEAALARGLNNVVVTHPGLPHLGYSIDAQAALAQRGAWIELTFNSLATGKVPVATALETIRQVGMDRIVLSGDLGQPRFGSIANGMLGWARLLLAAGFSIAEARQLLVTNPHRLLSL